MVRDDKYIVFRRAWGQPSGIGEEINDAVVILKRDVFAPPALDAYCNAIICVIGALREAEKELGVIDSGLTKKIESLSRIADYFKAQAEDSYDMDRKLPD